MAKIDLIMPGFSLATDQGSVAFCGVALIEGTKRILVDVAHTGRRPLLLQKLADRGLTPNDIDYVFLTHSHWDHMLNIDLFPNAKVLIHPLEREYAKQPHPDDYATAAYTSMILESHQLQEVREGDELDDGISVIETPGHSRGSMALLVRGDSETSAITGDALANGWSAASGLPRLVFWDEGEAKASIRKLLDSATVFYPGHDRPFRVRPENKVEYLQPAGIRIFGWPEGGETDGGLAFGYGLDQPRGTQLVTPPKE